MLVCFLCILVMLCYDSIVYRYLGPLTLGLQRLGLGAWDSNFDGSGFRLRGLRDVEGLSGPKKPTLFFGAPIMTSVRKSSEKR